MLPGKAPGPAIGLRNDGDKNNTLQFSPKAFVHNQFSDCACCGFFQLSFTGIIGYHFFFNEI